MEKRAYFDYAATTPLDPRVVDAMMPFLQNRHGNPSSLYTEGRVARDAIEKAREQVASLINAYPDEIFFNSGGTEGNNTAIRGIFEKNRSRSPHIVSSAIEHPSVMEPLAYLEKCGASVTRIPVEHDGIINPSEAAAALRPETVFISLMAANNVTGTIQPMEELVRIAHNNGIIIHIDAVQAAGKIPLDVKKIPADILTLSAHKMYGPKGTGALFIRRGLKLNPLLLGGGQEKGMRSSTENVAGIVGMGAAAELCEQELPDEIVRMISMREQIIDAISKEVPESYLIGNRYHRLPGHICLGFTGKEGEAIKLLLALDKQGIAVSSGSACSSHHAGTPSHVLAAMGMDPVKSRGSLRITMGRFTNESDISMLLTHLPYTIQTMNRISSAIS